MVRREGASEQPDFARILWCLKKGVSGGAGPRHPRSFLLDERPGSITMSLIPLSAHWDPIDRHDDAARCELADSPRRRAYPGPVARGVRVSAGGPRRLRRSPAGVQGRCPSVRWVPASALPANSLHRAELLALGADAPRPRLREDHPARTRSPTDRVVA